MKVLIIEDDKQLAESLAQYLTHNGYSVDFVLDGTEGEKRIWLHASSYDLIILDRMLPGRDGMEILKHIRSLNVSIPVLMLTAKKSTEDKIAGLNCGADDYLTKPFEPSELLARTQALLRRPKKTFAAELKVGRLTLNPATRKVFNGKKEITLTNKEFSLLEYFMRNIDKVINREEIFDHSWDFASNALSNVVDVYLSNLRHKLGQDDEWKLETVRGVGYRLSAGTKQYENQAV